MNNEREKFNFKKIGEKGKIQLENTDCFDSRQEYEIGSIEITSINEEATETITAQKNATLQINPVTSFISHRCPKL